MIKRASVCIALLLSLGAVTWGASVGPILQPESHFVDGAGLACAGCSLYSYAAGTTTPQATYTDSTGTTQNTNPIVLDVSGGAQIWLGTSAYKLVLEDTTGATLWTVDNVPGGVSFPLPVSRGGTGATTAAAAAAALVSSNPITPSQVNDALSLVGGGADPTGATDSTAAIKAVLATALSTGRTVICDPGTYLINSSLGNIDTSYSFVASGKECIIKAGAAMTNMATVGGSAPPPYANGRMSGITWNGNSLATTAIDFTNGGTTYVDGYAVDNTRIENTTGAPFTTENNFWNATFDNLTVCNNGAAASIGSGANAGADITFNSPNFCNSTGGGLTIANAGTGGADIHLNNPTFGGNASWDLQVGTSASPGLIVSINGGHFEEPQKWLQNFGVLTVSGTFFTNGSSSGTLGYLIDNEYEMLMLGGRTVNGGTGTILNAAETGSTYVYHVLNGPYSAPTTFGVDTTGALATTGSVKVGTTTVINPGSTLIHGALTADGYLITESGIQEYSGGGIPLVNTLGSTVATIGNDGSYTTTAGTITAPSFSFSGTPNFKTGTASNTDVAGQLTLSAGTASYTFAGTYTSAPICTATDTTAANAVKVGVTTGALTLTGTTTDVIDYVCAGRN